MASHTASARESPALISRVPYLPGLDGMRALAVVAVMVYHANKDWLHGGFLGVEVFFIISGYLITLLIVAEHEKTDGVSLGQFWLRRARRLLPALFTMMILVVVYTALFARDELGKLRGDVIAGTLYVANWYQIWIGAGYTAVNEFAPLRHLWSLAVEEQFYLFWPLVMIAVLGLGRDKLPTVGLWLIGMSLFISVVTAFLYHPGPIGTCEQTPDAYFQAFGRCFSKMDTLYLSTPTRMSGILLGAGLAMWWRPVALGRGAVKNKGRSFDLLAVLGIVGLGFLMWGSQLDVVVTDVGVTAGRFLFQGGFFLTGVATIAVITAVTHPGALMGKALGNPVFLWVGTRSYGLYLYHWPIYQAIRGEAGAKLSLAEFALAMALTVAMTEASFRFIETPIRKGQLGRLFKGLFARTPGAAERRRRLLIGGVVAAVLPIFAGVQLATAELKQNDVQEAIDAGEEFTTDLDEILGNDSTPPTGTDAPTTEPPDGTGSTPPTDTVAPEPGVTEPGQGSAPPTTKKPRKTTTTTTKPQREKIDVYAIGDSVMLGAAEKLTERGAVVDAAVSRQGTEGRDILQQLSDAKVLGNVVVIHLGTNGGVSDDTFNAMLDATRGVPLVVVLTIRADRSWTAGNNAVIANLPSRYPNVKVLDWGGLSNSCPGDCFASDNIHLNADGREYYARLVWEAIGRA